MSLASSKSERPVSLIWGCELRGAGASYTFQVPNEWPYEQQLALRTVCLGETARDEFHVLEIAVAEDGEGPRAPVPLATLKPSVLPMATLVGVELTPPVTFRLRAGSGPVYVSGQHVSLMPGASWEEEEEEEESTEESPTQPPRLQDARRDDVPRERRLERDEERDDVAAEDALPAKGRSRGRKAAPRQ